MLGNKFALTSFSSDLGTYPAHVLNDFVFEDEVCWKRLFCSAIYEHWYYVLNTCWRMNSLRLSSRERALSHYHYSSHKISAARSAFNSSNFSPHCSKTSQERLLTTHQYLENRNIIQAYHCKYWILPLSFQFGFSAKAELKMKWSVRL